MTQLLTSNSSNELVAEYFVKLPSGAELGPFRSADQAASKAMTMREGTAWPTVTMRVMRQDSKQNILLS